MCCLKFCNNDVLSAVQAMTGPELPNIVQSIRPTLWDNPVESDILSPPLEFNQYEPSFMLTSINYISWCIKTCNAHCIICDNPLKYSGLKPSICDRALCNFSYEEYGLGSDLAAEIRYCPELIDMLITFAHACVNDSRAEERFDPYPFGVRVEWKEGSGDRAPVKEMSFARGTKKDMDMLKTVLHALPSLEEMRKHAKTPESLKGYLDSIHLLCWPLLRWLVSSNRAHMQLLPPEKQIKGIPTQYQFLMLTAAPEKEQKFRAAKNKHGSHYAFHGSDFGNWHSILRVGLKNFSNTSRMTTGAAYGPGIYLAGNSSISAGYMRQGSGWSKSLFGSRHMSCIALAEVIKIQSYDKGSRQIFVCPEEDHVVTRYLFIFNTAYSGGFDAFSIKPPKSDYYS